MNYRLLESGEKIEAGDEVLLDDAETWVPVPINGGNTVGEIWCIGVEWNCVMFQPFRRKILVTTN